MPLRCQRPSRWGRTATAAYVERPVSATIVQKIARRLTPGARLGTDALLYGRTHGRVEMVRASPPADRLRESEADCLVAIQIVHHSATARHGDAGQVACTVALTLAPVAMDIDVQRLQLGDVILMDLPDEGANIEAKVVRNPDVDREIERSDSAVRVTLRVSGRDDLVMEWPLDPQATLVRGP
jgi:hypothetical protein